jgi:hypothetical protein
MIEQVRACRDNLRKSSGNCPEPGALPTSASCLKYQAIFPAPSFRRLINARLCAAALLQRLAKAVAPGACIIDSSLAMCDL